MLNKDPDNLDHLLRSWTEAPAPTGRLNGPVWRRIEERTARLSVIEWFGFFLRALDGRLARPRAMAALVAMALLLGVGLAEMRTRSDAARIDAEMSARYMALLELAGR